FQRCRSKTGVRLRATRSSAAVPPTTAKSATIFHSEAPLNFDDAFDVCQSRGGSLLDETNPASTRIPLFWELWRRHEATPSGQYWIGDRPATPTTPNNWKWINGRDVTISFWNLPG
ncbi:UNVERIFIED_CONTAM: hypothetical protein GTU68_048270, partial [Idotea baltica]|nr:hypothetical protein [Idotea baltica]